MSKFLVLLTVGMLAASARLAFPQTAATTDQLKQAFDDGRVSLTFAAKDAGERLEVTVKRVSSETLLLKLEKGETTFDFGTRSVTIVTDKAIELDLREKDEGSFTVLQTGHTRITAGAITWTKLPKKSPSPRSGEPLLALAWYELL